MKKLAALFCLAGAALAATAAEHAHAPVAPDSRTALRLDPAEAAFLLAEMRQFLVAVQRILAASLDDDMAGVAQAARTVGLEAHRADFAHPDSVVHGIRRKAPPAFFPLGRATHEAFDEIAGIATEFGDRDAVQRRLAENLGRCVACHASYRIVAQ